MVATSHMPSARMRSEGYSSCLSVCLFVDDYSRTTGYEAAYERYQQLQCYKGMKNSGDFAEMTAFERYGVKTSERANMQISTGLPRPALRTLEAPEIVTQGEYRLPRAI